MLYADSWLKPGDAFAASRQPRNMFRLPIGEPVHDAAPQAVASFLGASGIPGSLGRPKSAALKHAQARSSTLHLRLSALEPFQVRPKNLPK